MPVLSWLFSAGRSKNLRREAHGKCTAVAFHRKVPTLVRARPHRFLRRRASPSPGAVPFLLLDPSPTGSALRANPFPKVTDPFCRLPLPTLVYRLEAVHLGDLLRMWVRSGTKIMRRRIVIVERSLGAKPLKDLLAIPILSMSIEAVPRC